MNKPNTNPEREEIIRQYIEAYNGFDIGKMLENLDQNILFKNISQGEVNLSLEGLSAFKTQAEQARNFFSSRKQSIESIEHTQDETEIRIDYQAVLAVDLPNGFQKGDELNLKGKSIFKFRGNKIIELTDMS